MSFRKVYVKVNADHDADGSVIPKSIVYEDGRAFFINRIKFSERVYSPRTRSNGIRYTIMIKGQEAFLFDEENGRWFVEAKVS